MKFLSLSKLQPDMCLARPVLSENGRVLLNAGIQLRPAYIKKLYELGIPGVYVGDETVSDLEVPEVISHETRQKAIHHLKDAFASVRIGKTFQMKEINNSVNSIIDEIANNSNVLVNLTDIRSYDDYTFGHSVNVCVLSIILGLKLNLNELQIHDLAVGALLHDIGKMGVPEEIIKKPGALTEEEIQEVQKHSLYGWQILRQHPQISLLGAHIAYQHHERPNGYGYPRKLRKDKITLYARIVGLVDAYDAMTSERVYRSGMMPFEALNLIRELRGIQFCEEVVDVLLKTVPPYPVGCLVKLNNKEVGIVVDVNQDEHTKPVVRVLYQSNGRKLNKHNEVDLAKERYLSIAEVVQ